MGRDKALLYWAGEPLAARVARVLASLCAEVVVASGDGRRLGWLGLPPTRPRAQDRWAGWWRGWSAPRTRWWRSSPWTCPHASAPVLRLLAERWEGEPAVVARADGRLQPLHAVWAGAAAPALRARLSAGRYSVVEAARALGAQVVEPGQWAPADPSGRFARNLNRPDDLPGGRR